MGNLWTRKGAGKKKLPYKGVNSEGGENRERRRRGKADSHKRSKAKKTRTSPQKNRSQNLVTKQAA